MVNLYMIVMTKISAVVIYIGINGLFVFSEKNEHETSEREEFLNNNVNVNVEMD